jgi:uncharacterized protein (TIGR02284 family)
MERIVPQSVSRSTVGQGRQVFAISPDSPVAKEKLRFGHRPSLAPISPSPSSIGASNSTKQKPSKRRNEMPNPSSTLQELESTLRIVIQTLTDGQEGLQKIGDDLKDETLKRYFLAESLRRAQFRGELESVLHQEGVHDVHEGGTASGTVQRVWADLKSKLGGSDHTLLVTAEEGEDEAKAAYEDALKKELPFPVRQLLTTQAAHIATSHDYVKAARDGSV